MLVTLEVAAMLVADNANAILHAVVVVGDLNVVATAMLVDLDVRALHDALVSRALLLTLGILAMLVAPGAIAVYRPRCPCHCRCLGGTWPALHHSLYCYQCNGLDSWCGSQTRQD